MINIKGTVSVISSDPSFHGKVHLKHQCEETGRFSGLKCVILICNSGIVS